MKKGWKEDWDLANSLITLKVVSVELAGQVNSKKKNHGLNSDGGWGG